MKLLFNPYKNVGVYAENVWKTIFPIANEKKEGFSNACFCEVRVCAFVNQAVRMKNNFFLNSIVLDHKRPSATINKMEAHWKSSGTIR